MSNNIVNYWNGDHVLSSSDMIAVKSGIKKTTRIECASFGYFKEIKKSLDKHKLKYVFSDKKVFGKYNVYIALSQKTARQAKDVDPTYKIFIDNLSFNDSLEYVYQYSDFLSYPVCCVKEYVKNILGQKQIQNIRTIKELPDKLNFYLNNSLNGFSNYYISFHLPCSFLCENNLKHQKDIYEAIKIENPVFAEKMKQTLSNPFLMFLEKNLDSAYAVWDRRQGFIFDGIVDGGELKYKKNFFLKTEYPEYEKEDIGRQEISDIIQLVKKGNMVKVSKNNLMIYQNNSLLKSIQSDKYSFHIFNFL